MRLWTPVGNVSPRVAAEDTEIGGYFVPKGTFVDVALWSVHHSDAYYGNSVNEFRPDRWDEGKVHKFAHVAFSAGPRVCIGNNFSLVEQKLFVVKLLQRFKVALKPGYQFVLDKDPALHHMEKGFEVLLTLQVE
jgi:cytochrome P450